MSFDGIVTRAVTEELRLTRFRPDRKNTSAI